MTDRLGVAEQQVQRWEANGDLKSSRRRCVVPDASDVRRSGKSYLAWRQCSLPLAWHAHGTEPLYVFDLGHSDALETDARSDPPES
jgi:hypothetical protein